ncbi:hypothetical protein GUJ93_ZPchr0013g37736 [Zizania palustris]|uniref:Uncharacterized protein n=1 Tax=Zizania palustris TaxID=103762 RepID=A0A8J6BXR4_ZIZPA|nr:hypothetical protein GUJ93_ZPchr0013g37736 [Zizania palustris]
MRMPVVDWWCSEVLGLWDTLIRWAVLDSTIFAFWAKTPQRCSLKRSVEMQEAGEL